MGKYNEVAGGISLKYEGEGLCRKLQADYRHRGVKISPLG